jgi:hypothetical protein
MDPSQSETGRDEVNTRGRGAVESIMQLTALLIQAACAAFKIALTNAPRFTGNALDQNAISILFVAVLLCIIAG